MKRLINNLETLNKRMERRNSLKFAFLYGIIMGVGTAIGASIIAGVLFAYISMTLRTIERVPLISDIIEATQISDIVHKTQEEREKN